MSMNTQTETNHTDNTTPFAFDEALRYTGEAPVAPVNRTITAPYGAHHDIVSFRKYTDPDHAEVLTTRGTRIVQTQHLTRP